MMKAGKRGQKNLTKAGQGRAWKDEREVVLLALLSHEKNDTFSNVLVRKTLDSCSDLDASRRAFIKRLLEGVIERKTELDARIEHYTGRSVSRLHPTVHQLLRMGIYQILYMDSVPDSAACNESVRLVKKHGPARLAGFVNGVLRNAARDAEKEREQAAAALADPRTGADAKDARAGNGRHLPAPQTGAEKTDLSGLRWSMPDWLVQMWEDQLGAREAAALMDALMEIRPVCARLSSALSVAEKDRLLQEIREAGAQVEAGRWIPEAVRLRKTSDLRKLPGFGQGLWTVQDESSMLAVAAAGLQGPETVYDVCAAPGGKSFYAAELLACRVSCRASSADRPDQSAEDGEEGSADSFRGTEASIASIGTVHAFDLTKRKTDRIREGAERLHLSNLIAGERDARGRYPAEDGAADVVLCDLPCSGLGVIGRKRDIKYRASREGIRSLQDLQREILTSAVHYLRSGGILLYSTCTISREENEDNAAWIASELGLVPDDLAPCLPAGIPGIRGNMLQLLPHVHGTDGFFIARFRKP